jgi:hypothetical protein
MDGFFDVFRKTLSWWARPAPPVGGPYTLATGQFAVAGATAGNVALAGATAGNVALAGAVCGAVT